MERNISKHISRRDFIGKAGLASAALTVVPRHVLGGSGYTAPSDMLHVAGIGIGARGAAIIRGICEPEAPLLRPGRDPIQPNKVNPVKHANIYALCDVDTDKAAWMFNGYPRAKVYTDWREMLDKEPSIDAVAIGTPDHTHACISTAFMRAGKHVFVEKPMCKTVFEVREMVRVARETGVVTQVGNQRHASDDIRDSVELIQSGAIGFVREVHMHTNRPVWPQGNLSRPAGVPVPSYINYDVWLGPAPEKPYHPDIHHFNWRGLWDYGTGALGDMGAHIIDCPAWALNLGLPTKIHATSTPYNDDFLPQSMMVTYEFPARGINPPVKVMWVDGGLRSPRPGVLEDGRAVGSVIYYGDKGILMHGNGGSNISFVPEKPFEKPQPWIERTSDIFQDWIDAIKKGTRPCNDFAKAADMTEMMLLANIAVLHQRDNVTLVYDGANMSITNLPEANNHFHYEYRNGWVL